MVGIVCRLIRRIQLIDVTDETFNKDVIERSHDYIVLVDVWADWCVPCRAQLPVLKELDGEITVWNYLDIVKVNADENPETVRALGVRSIPTLLWYVNGEEVHREVGLKGKKDLLDITSRWI